MSSSIKSNTQNTKNFWYIIPVLSLHSLFLNITKNEPRLLRNTIKNTLSVMLPLSLGNPNCRGIPLTAALSSALYSFKTIHIILGDTLNRYNYNETLDGNAGDFRDKAYNDGDKFIDENFRYMVAAFRDGLDTIFSDERAASFVEKHERKNAFEKIEALKQLARELGIDLRFVRWDSITNDIRLPETNLLTLATALADDSAYSRAIEQSVNDYLHRHSTAIQEFSVLQRHNSKQYIKEEATYLPLYALLHGIHSIAYPGRSLAAFTAAGDFYRQHPTVLEALPAGTQPGDLLHWLQINSLSNRTIRNPGPHIAAIINMPQYIRNVSPEELTNTVTTNIESANTVLALLNHNNILMMQIMQQLSLQQQSVLQSNSTESTPLARPQPTAATAPTTPNKLTRSMSASTTGKISDDFLELLKGCTTLQTTSLFSKTIAIDENCPTSNTRRGEKAHSF